MWVYVAIFTTTTLYSAEREERVFQIVHVRVYLIKRTVMVAVLYTLLSSSHAHNIFEFSLHEALRETL